MIIIDGRKIRDAILENVRKELSQLPFVPVFTDVLVGNDPASRQYVDIKRKIAESVGITFAPAELSENSDTASVVAQVSKSLSDKNLSGLIVQLPLPSQIQTEEVLRAIDPLRDVDCLHPENVKLLYTGVPRFIPPTARAILYILDYLQLTLTDKKIVVLGEGELVGRPVAHLLRGKGLHIQTVTRSTENKELFIKEADVIISGMGNPHMIQGHMIKQGVIIIDAGTSEAAGTIVGDVDFDSVKDIAGAITPVPGGVGPITVAMLIDNIAIAAKQRTHHE